MSLPLETILFLLLHIIGSFVTALLFIEWCLALRDLLPGDITPSMEPEYTRLRKTTARSEFREEQFAMHSQPVTKVPYKSILLAIALFVIGSVLLVVGSLLVAGIIIPAEYADRTIPVLVLGVIAFLPGSYHTYIAWATFRRYNGYSYSDIPNFDD